MSPRRRALLVVLATLAVLAAVVVGVRLAPSVPAPEPPGPPAQDRPGPVLLVPGYGGGRGPLLELAARLESTGRDAQVLTLDGDGTGDLTAQVEVLDDAVDAALAAGAPSVDLVGYSAGGVVTGLWVAREDGASKVRRVVTLGAPLGGTDVAGLGAALVPDACPVACRQLTPGSAEITELAAAGVGARIPWLSVWTADDTLVTPPETARLPGAVNVEVQAVCPGRRVGHSGLPTDPVVTGLVLRALSTVPITQTVPATEPVPTSDTADCSTLRAAGAR